MQPQGQPLVLPCPLLSRAMGSCSPSMLTTSPATGLCVVLQAEAQLCLSDLLPPDWTCCPLGTPRLALSLTWKCPRLSQEKGRPQRLMPSRVWPRWAWSQLPGVLGAGPSRPKTRPAVPPHSAVPCALRGWKPHACVTGASLPPRGLLAARDHGGGHTQSMHHKAQNRGPC